MKVKLIYTELSNYYYGTNPYCFHKHQIAQAENGNYYDFYSYGNHNDTGSSVKCLGDSIEKKEEYSNDDGKTRTSLIYNNEDTDINLSKFRKNGADEYISDKIEQERIQENKQKLEKDLKRCPSLTLESILENKDLTEEETELVKTWYISIEREIVESGLDLVSYNDLIRNLDKIVKKEAIVTVHKKNNYLVDQIINNKDVKEGKMRRMLGNPINCQIYQLEGRRLPTEKYGQKVDYVGSYDMDKYPVDVYDSGTELLDNFHVVSNMEKSFSGSLCWKPDNNPYKKFDIRTGEEDSMKYWNDEEEKIKKGKKDFYEESISQAMEQFNVTKKQARQILKFAGTVSALKGATYFDKSGVSSKQLSKIVDKQSHCAIQKTLGEVEEPSHLLEVTKDSARTLLAIRELNNEYEKKVQETKGNETKENVNKKEGQKEIKQEESNALEEHDKSNLEKLKEEKELLKYREGQFRDLEVAYKRAIEKARGEK